MYYNVILLRVRATIVAVAKLLVSHFVSVFILSYPACHWRAPYYHLWLAPLYNIFPHYFMNGRIFEKKKVTEYKMCFLIFSTKFVRNISHSKKNWERYDQNIYRASQEECARLREGVPYVKVYRYNTKHLCPKFNGYGDNGQRSLKHWQLLHTCWLPNTY